MHSAVLGKGANWGPNARPPTSHGDQEDSWSGEGLRIVRVSEDRTKGSKQPAVFRSWHPENGEDDDDDEEDWEITLNRYGVSTPLT